MEEDVNLEFVENKLEFSSKTYLLYLGRNGAGINFARELDKRILFEKVFLSDFHENSFPFQSHYHFLDVKKDPLRLFLTLFYMPKSLRSFRRELASISPANLLIPMATPLDLKLIRRLKAKNINVIQIIHDSKRHPGDLWPNWISIRKMINRSNSLVFLSRTVADDVKSSLSVMPPYRIVQHPFFEISTSYSGKNFEFEYLLLIGRIRRYKGAQALVKAWKKVCHLDEFSMYHLVIAGKGTSLRLNTNKNRIHRMNYWLSDSEFDSLMKNAKVILFPYKEASQSGVMSKAIHAKKFVASSDIPPLVEQLSSYPNKFLGNTKDMESWLKAGTLEAENFMQELTSSLGNSDEMEGSWKNLVDAFKELSN
jgi:glycosyltransferase involved in cell wall biosynthesis